MKTWDKMSRWLGAISGGIVLYPLAWLGSRKRHSRVFHPRGVVCEGRLSRDKDVSPEFDVISDRLDDSKVLVRFSAALWKRSERIPDVLGCAFRISKSEPSRGSAREGEQDLLFATIRSPWTMAFSPLSTKTGDFLQNDYYAVSPFEAEGVGKIKLRLVVTGYRQIPKGTRRMKLTESLVHGRLGLRLQVRRVWRLGPWKTVGTVWLEKVYQLDELDQNALIFWPFQCSAGIVPRGFVHSLRFGAYRGSQAARQIEDRAA